MLELTRGNAKTIRKTKKIYREITSVRKDKTLTKVSKLENHFVIVLSKSLMLSGNS